MKAEIFDVTYDTKTAKEIHSIEGETLYRTLEGTYFLVCGNGTTDEDFEPFSIKEATMWLRNHPCGIKAI